MEGVGDVFGWVTGTIEGIAFVEYLILIGMFLMYRELRRVNARVDNHETECAARETATQERFAEGSKKIAVLDERTAAMQEDIREIKEAVNR